MSWDEFMDMDPQEVTNAVLFSGMPKEVVDEIWIKKRDAFDVYK